jgi:adhesin transport system membrane fusion protein
MSERQVLKPADVPVASGGEAPRVILGWSDLADQARARAGAPARPGLLYAIGIVVLLLLVWSAFAELDTVTRGQGKVIPSQQVQVIGSQDGGVVREILVREGDRVQAGDLLLRLDQTRSQATLGENRVELRGLSVKGRAAARGGGRHVL